MTGNLKVKDLPPFVNMEGVKMRTKKNVVGYFHSKADDVVLLSDVKGGLNEEGRLYPQILVKSEIFKEWTVLVDDDTTPVNCNKLTQMRFTMNE